MYDVHDIFVFRSYQVNDRLMSAIKYFKSTVLTSSQPHDGDRVSPWLHLETTSIALESQSDFRHLTTCGYSRGILQGRPLVNVLTGCRNVTRASVLLENHLLPVWRALTGACM